VRRATANGRVGHGLQHRRAEGQDPGDVPEIEQHHLSTNLVFDKVKDAYVVTVHRGGHELTTHLERVDADDCMNGIKCVSLGCRSSSS